MTDGRLFLMLPFVYNGKRVDRRETYKLVSELLPRTGGAAKLLEHATEVMRGASMPHCEELGAVLRQDDGLGHIYQAINAPALEAAYRGTARERRKFKAGEIPAVTQLFTPKWVVEFLLQNTLGRLWLEGRPGSALKGKWKWICDSAKSKTSVRRPLPNPPPDYRQTGNEATIRAKDLRICDPACGTMNFGLVAIDMLREIYREEGEIRDPREIDSCIISHNLIGFDIDPTAIDLARRSLELKIGRAIGKKEHRLCVCDALFDPKCDEAVDVVVTNPPYLSARNLDPAVVKRLKKRYPCGWRDLYACFVLRALELLRPGGRAGILSMQSFMFTAAFERMRSKLCEQSNVETVAHFGPGLFEVGNPGTLQTAAIVLRRKPTNDRLATFFRLVDAEEKETALAKQIESSAGIRIAQADLSASPRGAWMYWISPTVSRAFADLPKLGGIAPPRQGLATTDNARFVRYWWEVEPPGFAAERRKWMPYAKGGRFRRWYEGARYRVNWEDDGREIKAAIVERYPYLNGQWQWVAKNSGWYRRAGITYSYLTSGNFSARRLEEGTIFDVAGSSLFPDDPLGVLGVLNSSAAREFLSAINPTVNFQVGDLRQLPMPRAFPEELCQEVGRAIECTRRADSFDETSVDFVQPENWDAHERADLLREIWQSERKIDRIVAELYELMSPAKEATPAEDLDHRTDLARRWISFVLGTWLGRWGNDRMGQLATICPLDQKLAIELRSILTRHAGEVATSEIIKSVGGLERFFARDFLPWHQRLYRDRPVFWGFGTAEKSVLISSTETDASVVREALMAIGASLPAGWRRWTDDGIRINLAPLRQWIADKKLRKSLDEVDADLHSGRLQFSQTSRWLRKE
jgi:hypothetical protein